MTSQLPSVVPDPESQRYKDAVSKLEDIAADLVDVVANVEHMTDDEKCNKMEEVQAITDEAYRCLGDDWDEKIGDVWWEYNVMFESVMESRQAAIAAQSLPSTPSKIPKAKKAPASKGKRPQPVVFDINAAKAKLPSQNAPISAEDVRAGKDIAYVDSDEVSSALESSDFSESYDSDGNPDESTQIRQLIASAHDKPIIATQTATAKRRLAAQAAKSTAGTQSAQETPAKKKQRLKADKEKAFPDLTDKWEDYKPWLNVDEVLEIGARFAAGSGDRKQRGKHVKSAAYKRHEAAPYAWNYRGQLYSSFWPFRKMKKDGKQILTDKQIKTYCHGLNESHLLLPWSVNAQGDAYRRLASEIKAVRDKRGRFRHRAEDEPLLVNDLHKSDALAAAISGENDLINLKNFDAKDFGIERFTAAREEGLRTNTIAVVTTARNARLAKETKILIQKGIAKGIAKAETESQQRMVLLERRSDKAYGEKEHWKAKYFALREGLKTEFDLTEEDLGELEEELLERGGNGDSEDEDVNMEENDE